MKDNTGTDQDNDMDAAAAAAIIADAGDRARRTLQPGHRVLLIVWGLLWLFGYGVTWLTDRGQHPYHGPNLGAYAVTVLLTAVVAFAAVTETRADTGVGGLSEVRRRLFFLAVLAGLAAMFALEGALDRAGASRGVLGVFAASAPMLVVGLLYLARFSAERNWAVAGLGLWLIIVAAASGYAGPLGVWAVGALAVGPAFLLVAAVEPMVRRA